MNAVNRLLVILLILAIIVLTALLVIVPKQMLDLTAQFFTNMGAYTDAWMTQQWALFASGRVIIGGAIVLLCLILLWLELRRPRKKTIRTQKVAGGEAHIAVDSVAQRLSYNIDQLPDVVKVSPRITSRSRGVDIDLVLETSPEIDIPMKTEEVLQVTREVIEDQMGLKLGKVQVKIKHAPYPKE
jgi:uncharacterized alkaline shock family protein YloU